jgi:hypothetical protein
LFLVLISVTSLVAYLITHISGQAHSESLNLADLRYYAIACSILPLVLAVTSSVYAELELYTGLGGFLPLVTRG